MIDARQNAGPLARILGSVVAFAGVLQSDASLAFFGICFSALSCIAVLYSQRKPNIFRLADVSIDGLNLDSLNIANLRRRLNRTLVLRRAFQIAIIEGSDLNFAWQYDGFCRSQDETGIEFSLDTENNVPFEELDCFAFDLLNDPERLHRIRPTLIGNDGLSKKIRVPFLRPLTFKQPFSVLLNCKLPGCVTTGIQYYTSSFSFEQRSIESAAVHLIFARCRPDWVRVYTFNKPGRPRMVGELRPFRDDGVTCEYVDMVHNAPGQSVRVFTYNLVPASHTRQQAIVGVRDSSASNRTHSFVIIARNER